MVHLPGGHVFALVQVEVTCPEDVADLRLNIRPARELKESLIEDVDQRLVQRLKEEPWNC